MSLSRAEEASFVAGVVVCCRCHWASRPQYVRRWDCSGLGHVARRCFGTNWYGDVPGARSTRDGDTENEDNSNFARFLNLTNMPCSVLP